MQSNTYMLFHAIPGFILLIIVESFFLIKEHRFNKNVKHIPASIALAIGFIIINIFSKGIILFAYQLIFTHRIYVFNSNNFFAWILCFIGNDFTYYWFHRLSHQVRILWASHAVHHSSEEYSLLTAGLRQTWTGNLTGTFLFWAWLPFMGFNPGVVMMAKSVSLVYQFWIHTETIKKLPVWIEAIFNTPSHHRVHHGSDLIYLDKNYAGTLIIWDKFFGTYQQEEFKPKYGLTKNIQSSNPFVIAFHEWVEMFQDLKKSNCFFDCFNYLFNAPGWSKDGSNKTIKQLRSAKTKTKNDHKHAFDIQAINKSYIAIK